MSALFFLRQVGQRALIFNSSTRPCLAKVPKTLTRLSAPTVPWQSSRSTSMWPSKVQTCAFPKTLSLSRNFHASQPRRLHPIMLLIVTPLSRLGAIIVGRKARKWYKNLPEEEQRKLWNKIKKNQADILGLGLLGVAFVLYLYVSHLEDCPITGRRKFLALKDDQISRIGKVAYELLIQKYEGEGTILPENAPAHSSVSKMLNRILKANEDLPQIRNKDWTITVIKDCGRINAMVLPSGDIFVFTGMLHMCTNDDQLGFVLGHEISHVVLGHMAENLSYVKLLNLLVLLPLALLWAVLPTDGIAIVTHFFFSSVIRLVFKLPYSRDMEKEADEVGLILASKSCFDVREAPEFWTNMVTFEKEETVRPPEFISTHPSSEKRGAHLTELMPSALKMRLDCGCSWLGEEEAFFSKGIFPDIITRTK